MPHAFVDGGGELIPTTSELAAYHASLAKDGGNRTAAEQAVIKTVEDQISTIGNEKTDSGGTGGRQAAMALEVAAFVGELEARRQASINQWSKEAARGSRKAQTEMHGADTPSIADLAWLVYELRERLNDSPY